MLNLNNFNGLRAHINLDLRLVRARSRQAAALPRLWKRAICGRAERERRMYIATLVLTVFVLPALSIGLAFALGSEA